MHVIPHLSISFLDSDVTAIHQGQTPPVVYDDETIHELDVTSVSVEVPAQTKVFPQHRKTKQPGANAVVHASLLGNLLRPALR